MDDPSSASSADGSARAGFSAGKLPWAALLALLIVAVADRSVYRSSDLWHWFDGRLSGSNLLEQGLVLDRIALLESRVASDAPRVFLVGSSRMNRGFRPDLVPSAAVPRAHFTKLAHPQFFPFEIRAATGPILAHDPQVVVLALSELETHTRIKLVPGASFGDLQAVVDLTRLAGLSFAIDRHVMLSRIALEGFFNTYHYRGVVDRAGIGRLRHFERDRRLKVTEYPERSTTFLGGERKPIAQEELAAIVADFDERFPGRGSIIQRAQFGIVRSITRGEHAEINLGLLRKTIELLRAANVEVIVLEPPIYPGAGALYDTSIRDDFVRFAEGLVRDQGARFVPLDEGPEYVSRDFADLTHLDRDGAAKFTGVVLSSVREALGQDPEPAR